MCVFSSALCVWLLNFGLSIRVCLHVCLHTCRPACPPPPFPSTALQGLRLARTGGHIKTQSSSAGPAGEKCRGKDLFRCCVNHCFISTLLPLSLSLPHWGSDISQGFWLWYKCEHNAAIEIVAHTSWPVAGSALASAPAATTQCSYLLAFLFSIFLSQDAA